MTDEGLYSLFPLGYEVLAPPQAYVPIRTRPSVRAHPYAPIRTPARKLTATPQGFYMQKEGMTPRHTDDAQPKGNLLLKPEDAHYFDKLLVSELFRRSSAGHVGSLYSDGTSQGEFACIN